MIGIIFSAKRKTHRQYSKYVLSRPSVHVSYCVTDILVPRDHEDDDDDCAMRNAEPEDTKSNGGILLDNGIYIIL